MAGGARRASASAAPGMPTHSRTPSGTPTHSPARSRGGIQEDTNPRRHSRGSGSGSPASSSGGSLTVLGMIQRNKAAARKTFKYSQVLPPAQSVMDRYHAAWTDRFKVYEDPPDAFEVLAFMFGFQPEAVRNQQDALVSTLASRLSKIVTPLTSAEAFDKAPGVLQQHRYELFHNYDRWSKYVGAHAVEWDIVFGKEPKEPAARESWNTQVAATSVALMLLIWGEAGNLRFCPEFLCFVYHKMAWAFVRGVQSWDGNVPDRIWAVDYLDKVVAPAYDLLALQAAEAGHDTVDHTAIKNYDDFNEIFWRAKCLNYDIDNMFKTTIRKLHKTFVERQSWALCLFAFWRLHTFFLTSLHSLITLAACQDLGTCGAGWLLTPVFTLFGCSAVKDVYELVNEILLKLFHNGSALQVFIVALRLAGKLAFLVVLVGAFLLERLYFVSLASIGLLVAVGSEAVLLTPLWNLMRLARSTTFSRLWSLVNGAMGVNTVNLYTRVHRQPPLSQRLSYCLLWVLVLGTKFSFSYFVVLRPLVTATHQVWEADVDDSYNFLLFTVTDPHNVAIIVAMWVGSITVFFVDTHIWFVLWSNIFAAFVGLRRRVGEVHTSNHVVDAFNQMHELFFEHHLKATSNVATATARSDCLFAQLWNEIITSMRNEDTLGNTEALRLRYFIVQLAPSMVSGGAGVLAPPPSVLLPEFLHTGAIRRSVDEVKNFAKEQEELLAEISRLEGLGADTDGNKKMAQASGVEVDDRREGAHRKRQKLAGKQNKWLKDYSAVQDVEQAVSQAFITLFVVVDGLCHSGALSDSLWAAQVAIRGNKDQQPLRAAASLVGNVLLFRLHEWPAVVEALAELVRALVDNNFDACSGLLERLMQALTRSLDIKTTIDDCKTNGQKEALAKLQLAKTQMNRWLGDAASRTPEALDKRLRAFRQTNESFLKRSKLLLDSGADSQPGFLVSEEARRRIAFFINSMFVEQPKDVGSVLAMPSFSTLTPYYNEDVVLSLASLKQATEDGVTVLEYLRTIYPGEWDAFLERMMDQHGIAADVIEELKTIIYNTQAGSGAEAKAKVKQQLLARLVSSAGFKMMAAKRTEDLHASGGLGRQPVANGVAGGCSSRGGRTAGGSREDLPSLAVADTNNVGDGTMASGTQRRGSAAAGAAMSRKGSNASAEGGAAAVADNGGLISPVAPPTLPPTLPPTPPPAPAAPPVDHTAELLWELQLWASHRAQTLARTVRGMMRFAEAVRLLATIEHLDEFQPSTASTQALDALQRSKTEDGADLEAGSGVPGGQAAHWEGGMRVKVHEPAINRNCAEWKKSEALAEAKYRYVVSCQVYKKMKGSKNRADTDKADCIDRLARDFPGLRIAYVDAAKPTFKSVLLKWDPTRGEMAKEYEVVLPGDILVGEGKPNNQNHAIIFTRGEAIQAIDMNQDQGLEDALKCRQLMAEFGFGDPSAPGLGRIVGYREHVFTHNVSSVAQFFSLQELNFVTATQRVVADPLAVRFHYGHPDLFDRVTAVTNGGISKASKGINLSEDIFAGFNWILRGGMSSQADYLQCGKGRDTGVGQITGFTAKISMGNGMQARSREVYRLAHLLDFPRMLTFYYSTVGGFMNQVFLVWSIFLFIYARVYLGFADNLDALLDSTNIDAAVGALSAQYALQLGFLLILPIPLVVAVEFGLARAGGTLAGVLLRLSPFFFVFSTGTNAFYVNGAIENGMAKYQATGRGFTITHEPFLASWRAYFSSHYLPAAELLALLFIYIAFDPFGLYFLQTFSVWLLVVGWLFCPVMFNPRGLDASYVRRGADEWWAFMVSPVEDARKAWTAWYNTEMQRDYTMIFRHKLEALLRRCRFLLICWGFLERFKRSVGDTCPAVAWLALVCLGVCLLFSALQEATSVCSRRRNAVPFANDTSRRFVRMLELLGLFAVLTLLVAAVILNVATTNQIAQAIASFLFMQYFVVQVLLLFVRDAVARLASVRESLRVAHTLLGALMLAPVLLLSFLPFMKDLQITLNFNEDFSKRFNIAGIFVTEEARRSVTKKNT